MKTNFLQAYKQAPWRIQLQWIGLFLLVLLSVALVAGVYLSISGKAATTGRNIQILESDIEILRLEINDLSTHLANISSAKVMQERLENMDMMEMDTDLAMYLEVPGYLGRDVVVIAPPVQENGNTTKTILPEFTESLWDWFASKLSTIYQGFSDPTKVLP